MQKWKWFSARLFFLSAAVCTACTGGILGYLLGPLYSWYFFNDLNFLKYHQYLPRLVSAFWRQIGEWVQNPRYREMFFIPWTSAPMNCPDMSIVQISGLWQNSDKGCGACDHCCIKRACPLHDMTHNRCRSYGSFFWRYFNCGRYPENIRQIRFYDCKKWVVNNGVNESTWREKQSIMKSINHVIKYLFAFFVG